MDKISIIIPVYNVEPYIKRCLDSVINQTYTNLEILCIDDGSIDNSGKICDEYAEKDNRIKVFHQVNRGVSAARNVGLKNITGQYVGFVDSDDWIEPDMYEMLYKVIRAKGVSISVANFYKDTDTDSVAMVNIEHITEEVICQKEMLRYSFKIDYCQGFHVILCNKLFRADIFKDNKSLKLDERFKYAEDTLFYTLCALTDNCTGIYTPKPLYHYYQRNSSVIHTGSLDTKINGLTVYQLIINLFINNRYKDISVWVKRLYCYHASVLSELAIRKQDKRTLEHMQNEMRTYLKEYIETNQEFPERIDRINRLLNARIVKVEDELNV